MNKKTDISIIIKPNINLQAKAGFGAIPSATIKKCQSFLDNHNYDFAPVGQGILDRLQTHIEKTKDGKLPRKAALEKMLECVMQLKANAAMFGYPLVTRLAEIIMGLLETIQEIDDDALEIVEAHHNTLGLIFREDLRGDGGAKGKAFEKELKSACARYYKRHAV